MASQCRLGNVAIYYSHLNEFNFPASECCNMNPDTPEWECANSVSQTNWVAEYDFNVDAATNLNLNLNFACTGANLELPAYPGVPPTRRRM